MNEKASQGLRDWIPAFAGMVCLGLGAGLIGIYGFFVEPLADEFGVGVGVINIGPVALLLVPGLLGPLVGKLVDRLPIRRILLTGATIAMLALCISSAAPTLWVAGLGFLGFSLGLSMYGPVVVNGMLVKIYAGREARALAIAAMGISFASALLPPLVGAIIGVLEWRVTLAALALGVLVILWFVLLVAVPATGGVVRETGEAGGADKRIYGDAVFWFIGLAVALAFNVAIVLAICYPPFFIHRDYSPAQAGLFVSLAGLSGLIGKTLIAVASDYVERHTRGVVLVLLGGQAIGLLLLLQTATTWQTVPVMILMGVCGGGFLPMHSYLNSRYYPATMIGQVTGAQMPMFLPFGLIGAPLAGYMFDLQGHYDNVMLGLSVAMCVAVLLVLLLPPPKRVA